MGEAHRRPGLLKRRHYAVFERFSGAPMPGRSETEAMNR
jgi:hypothetical protein